MMSLARLRPRLLALACAALLAGCAARATPPPAPADGGYLPPASAGASAALVPPPPAEGSLALALDDAISRRALALRDTPAWALAIADADLTFPPTAGTFSCALGAPVSAADTPRLYALLQRSLIDVGLAARAAKDRFPRQRPFAVNHAAACSSEVTTPQQSMRAYPSGHSAIGFAWGLILAEIAPAQREAILARAQAYAVSRVVCNVHWYSDVVQGISVGAAAVARLQADPSFQADLAAARDELAAARARGLPPIRDCAAEAAAMAQQRALVP